MQTGLQNKPLSTTTAGKLRAASADLGYVRPKLVRILQTDVQIALPKRLCSCSASIRGKPEQALALRLQDQPGALPSRPALASAARGTGRHAAGAEHRAGAEHGLRHEERGRGAEGGTGHR